MRLQACIFGKTDKEKYEETKNALARGEKLFRGANVVLSGDAAKQAGKVADVLGRVNGAVDTVEKGVTLYKGVEGFRDLARYDPATDPDGFARAAGSALAGLGEVMKLSRIPGVSAYGDFLSNAGDFFTNMRAKLDPSIRWKDKFEQIDRESR